MSSTEEAGRIPLSKEQMTILRALQNVFDPEPEGGFTDESDPGAGIFIEMSSGPEAGIFVVLPHPDEAPIFAVITEGTRVSFMSQQDDDIAKVHAEIKSVDPSAKITEPIEVPKEETPS